MVLGSFLFLYRRKRKASKTLADLKRTQENIQRKKKGLPPIYPVGERCKRAAKKRIAALFRPVRNFFAPEKLAGKILRLGAVFLAGQTLGLVLCMILSLKFARSFDYIGTWVGVGTQVVTIAMVLRPSCRCLVLMCLPNLVTGRMRTILLMLVFIWVLQGPALNVTRNTRGVATAMACVQHKVSNDIQEVQNVAKNILSEQLSPFLTALEKMHGLMNKMKLVLHQAHRILLKMEARIKRTVSYMSQVVDGCHDIMTTPYYQCRQTFRDVHSDCLESLAWFPPSKEICSVIDWASGFCEISRLLHRVCQFPKYLIKKLKKHVFDRAKKGIREAIRRVEEALYYDVDLSDVYEHDLHIESNITQLYEKLKLTTDVYRKIIEVLLEILSVVLVLYACIMPFASSLFFWYRYKKRNPISGNYLITSEFRAIEDKRHELGKETVLPLLAEERKLFIKPSSLRIAKKEKIKLAKKLVLTTCALLVPLTYIVVDIVVYEFVIQLYSYFGKGQTAVEMDDFYTLSIAGSGVLASMYNDLMNSLLPSKAEAQATDRWRMCFTEPAPPDYDLLYGIGVVIVLVYVMCLVETYALRLRIIICNSFYPERARVRAIALYSHILNGRGRLFQILFKMMTSGQSANVGAFLGNRYPVVGKLLHIFGADKQSCFVCAQSGPKGDTTNFGICPDDKCLSVYCMGCYAARTKCINCHSPFKDQQTLEEKDSSAEESENEDVGDNQNP